MSVAPRLFTAALILAALLLFLAVASAARTPLFPGASAHAASKGDPKDCDDFKSQKRAQKWFKKHNPSRDPAGLDADNDGLACEDNPCPCVGKAKQVAPAKGGCVSKKEFKKVKRGMSRRRVAAIFDTDGKLQYQSGNVMNREYKTCDPGGVIITYQAGEVYRKSGAWF